MGGRAPTTTARALVRGHEEATGPWPHPTTTACDGVRGHGTGAMRRREPEGAHSRYPAGGARGNRSARGRGPRPRGRSTGLPVPGRTTPGEGGDAGAVCGYGGNAGGDGAACGSRNRAREGCASSAGAEGQARPEGKEGRARRRVRACPHLPAFRVPRKDNGRARRANGVQRARTERGGARRLAGKERGPARPTPLRWQAVGVPVCLNSAHAPAMPPLALRRVWSRRRLSHDATGRRA